MTEKTKTAWPELVGFEVESAVEKIKQERPDLHVVKFEEGGFGTTDVREDRVRVYHTNGQVSREPFVG